MVHRAIPISSLGRLQRCKAGKISTRALTRIALADALSSRLMVGVWRMPAANLPLLLFFHWNCISS